MRRFNRNFKKRIQTKIQKFMKKLFLMMAIAASAGLFFAGCSKDNEGTDDGGNNNGGNTEQTDTTYVGNYNNDIKDAQINVIFGAIDTTVQVKDAKGTFKLDEGGLKNSIYLVPENSTWENQTLSIKGMYNSTKDTITFKDNISGKQLLELAKQTGLDITSAFGPIAGGQDVSAILETLGGRIEVTGKGALSGYNKMDYTLNLNGNITVNPGILLTIPVEGVIRGIGTQK